MMGSGIWPQRVYGLAFSLSVVLCLALKPATSFSTAALIAAIGTAGVILRLFANLPVPLFLAIAISALALLTDPLGTRLLQSDRTAADIVQSVAIWPECLMLLIAARLVAERTRQSQARRWRLPLAGPIATGEQSVLAATLVGAALTLAIFAVVPTEAGASALTVEGLLRSALRGTTPVHVAIIFAAATCLALIVTGFAQYLRGCRTFLRLRNAARDSAPPTRSEAPAWVADCAGSLAGNPIAVLLAGLLSGHDDDPRLGAASLYHDSARLFLRRLLGLLPLLGFLGTVVGLAAAIAGLPHGLSGGIDLTASLGGLAIKFETTFLGLTAYLVGSLMTNLLDRLEAEARAGLLQLAAAIDHGRL